MHEARAAQMDRDVTGLILAGGRGSRMGGVDKGLQLLAGQPLVEHALARLRPQVQHLAINANRHAERYAAFGVPVWRDDVPDFSGPLAGMLAGLTHCRTEWLVSVPCDTPNFPLDLVARLVAAAQQADARIAMPVTPGDTEDTSEHADAAAAPPLPQPQPVFCLMHRSLRPALAAALAAGERKIERFTRSHGQLLVPFAQTDAFLNINTAADLERVQRR
jgi:molybdopterin-guanine dinucleotide biosynthesis protein A